MGCFPLVSELSPETTLQDIEVENKQFDRKSLEESKTCTYSHEWYRGVLQVRWGAPYAPSLVRQSLTNQQR
jgi:hypothetical protein